MSLAIEVIAGGGAAGGVGVSGGAAVEGAAGGVMRGGLPLQETQRAMKMKRGGLLLETSKPVDSALCNSKLSPLAAKFIPSSGLPSVTRISALSFCYLNARSLLARSSDGMPRFDHLYNYAVVENSYDIILITETHIDQTIDDIEINISGYQLFRKDRNRNGGGVAIYCRDELAPVELLKLKNPELESIYIKVLKCNMPCILGVCYRPPNQTALNRESTLEALRVQLD